MLTYMLTYMYMYGSFTPLVAVIREYGVSMV